MGINSEKWLFTSLEGGIAPKPYIPPKLTYIRHIRGMSTPPKWFPSPEIVSFELFQPQAPHSKLSTFSCFGDEKSPVQKFWNFSRLYACRHQFTSVFFKNSQNRCRISDQKATLCYWQKNNTFWRHLAKPLRSILPKFLWVCIVAPHWYYRFHPDLFRFWGDITETSPTSPCNSSNWMPPMTL